MTTYLDIETLDFFADPAIKALPRDEQLRAIRFGIAVTYNDQSDEWSEWLPDQLWDLRQYLHADIVAGWNIIEFDMLVIEHNLRRVGHILDESTTITNDLFHAIKAKTGRWYKLDLIAQINLGRAKSADGQQAALWLRDWHTTGNDAALRQALDYCRLDVELERDLYLHLASGKPLRLPPRIERQEINELLYYVDGTIERIPDAMGAISTR